MDPEEILFGKRSKEENEIWKALADLAPRDQQPCDDDDDLEKMMEDFGGSFDDISLGKFS